MTDYIEHNGKKILIYPLMKQDEHEALEALLTMRQIAAVTEAINNGFISMGKPSPMPTTESNRDSQNGLVSPLEAIYKECLYKQCH